jgi:hypothetical protein
LDDKSAPAEILEAKPQLVLNLKELFNFHANILLKGLQYYSDDPGKVGHTFLRLERDFENHVYFLRELPNTLKLIAENKEVGNYLQVCLKFSFFQNSFLPFFRH